jgi:hypothetical protein
MSNEGVENLDAPPPISATQKAKILSDPNVAKIAAELGMSVDEFANTVGYYLNNPDTEPGFLVVSDENLRKMGVEPPSADAIEANVRATVELLKAGTNPSDFRDAKRKTVELEAQGEQVKPTKVDPDLEDTVKKARIPRGS